MFLINRGIHSDISGLYQMYSSTVLKLSSSAGSKNHQLSDLSPSLAACVNVDAKVVGTSGFLIQEAQ